MSPTPTATTIPPLGLVIQVQSRQLRCQWRSICFGRHIATGARQSSIGDWRAACKACRDFGIENRVCKPAQVVALAHVRPAMPPGAKL